MLFRSQAEHAGRVHRALQAAGLRAELDVRNEKLGYKVREAQLEKIPYMLVVGDQEVQAEGVNVRTRSGQNLGLKSVGDAIGLINADAEEPFKRGGMSYRFSYASPV